MPASPDPVISALNTNPLRSTKGEEGLANISSSDNDISDSDRNHSNRSNNLPMQHINPTTMNNSNNNSNDQAPSANSNKNFSYVDKFLNNNNNSSNINKPNSSPKKRQTTDEDKENKRQRRENVYDEVPFLLSSFSLSFSPLLFIYLSKASTCTICFESWKTSGLHRACCLKCGHLFGKR